MKLSQFIAIGCSLGAALLGTGCSSHHVVRRDAPVAVHRPPRVIVTEPAPAPRPRVVTRQPAPVVVHPAPPPVVVVQPTPPPVVVREPIPRPRVVRAPEPVIEVIFSPRERDVIHGYLASCTEETHKGRGKKGKSLPPGLAKKVARGEELPPGWQKKVVRGERMPEQVYKRCEPLPQEVVVQLPPPPPGTIVVTVDGRAVRLARATLEILDVLDVL
jgi:hypothetical protein